MKAKDADLANAQRFLHTYERVCNAGLVMPAECLSHATRRIAYVAQEAIIEYPQAPEPKKPSAGFTYATKG